MPETGRKSDTGDRKLCSQQEACNASDTCKRGKSFLIVIECNIDSCPAQFDELKAKIQQAQLRAENIEENTIYLEECLNHLLEIRMLLQENEEASITINLHLLHDPSRFVIARLLDPHGLDYKWPFGGLVFSYTAISEDNGDEIKPEYIFIGGASVVGAGWNKQNLCLTEERENIKGYI